MEIIKRELFDKYDVLDVIGILELNYKIESNIFYEDESNVSIKFLLNDNKSFLMRFKNVNSLQLKYFGGSFNQLLGFVIIENPTYEKNLRYHIKDYENSIIDFYCESYEIITNV